MEIYEVEDGYVVADEGGWLPGVYATRHAAHRALTIDIEVLDELVLAFEGRPLVLNDLDLIR